MMVTVFIVITMTVNSTRTFYTLSICQITGEEVQNLLENYPEAQQYDSVILQKVTS